MECEAYNFIKALNLLLYYLTCEIALVTFFIIDCVFGVMLSQSCKIRYNVAILGGGGALLSGKPSNVNLLTHSNTF